MKQCATCGKWKPETDFYAHPNNADGLQYSCKECLKEYSREWHKRQGKEANRKYALDWYHRNKARVSERQKKQRNTPESREKRNAYRRELRKRKKEQTS